MEIFDIFQKFRIESDSARLRSVRSRTASAHFKLEDAQSQIRVISDIVDHLSLVCMAMCELLAEIAFDGDMFEAKMTETNLRDGRRDGKLSEDKPRSSCGRKMAARHVVCIWCGTES